MLKVIPFIDTIGTENYRNLLNKEFSSNLLYEDNVCLFKGWVGYKKNGHILVQNDVPYLVNDDKTIILEFYINQLININKENKEISISKTPNTINDFINLMLLYDIELYWASSIEEKYKPKDFLHKQDVKKYYQDLLSKIDKSHELK